MLRLLHVYGGNLYGGVERLLVALAEQRASMPAIEQHFGLCFAGRMGRELEACGVPPLALGSVRASRPWQVVAARTRLRSLLSALGADVVVCHAWWSYAIFAPAVQAAGIPLGLWAHDCVHGRGWLEAWARRRRPDFIIALGPYLAANVGTMFAAPAPAAWLPPIPARAALSAPRRSELRAGLGAAPDDVVILQAARLEPWKGHRLLLDALARVDTASPWRLWMAGGPQRAHEYRAYAALQERARSLGLETRIQWLGDRSDMESLMGAADVYCQPNTGPEPFGVVFAEALASGLPIVTTSGGGPAQFLPAECACLVPPQAHAVADALQEFLENSKLRISAGLAARAFAASHFDPTRQMSALQDIFAAAARSAPRA